MERGEAIDFVRWSIGLPYPEALSFLGIDWPQVTAQRVRKMLRKRLERLTTEWNERELAWTTLGTAIRIVHEIMREVRG